jgi:hypothetical protein
MLNSWTCPIQIITVRSGRVDSSEQPSSAPSFPAGPFSSKEIGMGPAAQKRAIDRAELARVCLEELRLWPGCESVVSVGVLSAPSECFVLRVIDYGAATARRADQAIRAIERMKSREYRLKAE